MIKNKSLNSVHFNGRDSETSLRSFDLVHFNGRDQETILKLKFKYYV